MDPTEKYSPDSLVLLSTTNSINVDLKQSCETIYGQFEGGKCQDFAFRGSQNTLLSINFPQGSRLSDINECAFYQCSKLSSVDFTNCELLTKIGVYAFSSCTSLTNVILPIHLTTISPYCFELTSISAISIPNKITKLSDFCFQSCTKLKTITIKPDSTLNEIGHKPFLGAIFETFFIPKSVTIINLFAFEQTIALKEFTIDPSNPTYNVSDGILFNKGQTCIIRFPANKSNYYSIPEITSVLTDDAFSCSIIESIQFSSNINAIGSWCFFSSKIKSLIIPDSIINIGNGAFCECVNLNTIVISKNIKIIPYYCFYHTNISKVTIPEGVTDIGDCVFLNCMNLNEIVLPSTLKTLGASCFPRDAKLTFSKGSDFTIDEQMIVYNKNKTTIIMCLEKRQSYIIPSTVEIIGKNAFGGFENLNKVEFEINSCLYEIGDSAFYGCQQLSNIVIPPTVSKFGTSSFYGCKLLHSVFFGSKLSIISNKCFENCLSLNIISFTESITGFSINESAFSGCRALATITLCEGVLSIGMFCFRGCTNLTNINIPSTVTFIGINAFSNTNINTITFAIGSKMRVLSPYVFSGISTLQYIKNIPSTIESIESNSFEFTGIKNFTVPVSTVNISNYAFRGCASMTTFTIPSPCSLMRLGNFVFEGCRSLSIIECIDNDYFVVYNGALFNKALSNLIYFPPASQIKFFSFSQNTKQISSSAFFGCKNLEGIMIPENSIELIGFSAFAECTSLKYINIPICVKTVEKNAFSGCISLNCGVNIQNKTREFIENLVATSGISRNSLKDCSVISCKQVCYQSFISSSYYFVFILI